MGTDLQGKVALITGAAHGQGCATALALAKEGVHIAALDVARQLPYPGYPLGTRDALDSLAAECQRLGVRCLPLAADGRDDPAGTAAARATAGRPWKAPPRSRSASGRRATCRRCRGSSRRTWPRRWSSWRRTGPATSPARSSSWMPACLPAEAPRGGWAEIAGGAARKPTR